MTSDAQRPWWEPGIIYQIYPRSFQDSAGDGTGDLQGIIDRLDYLAWLGVDAVWISPIFRSPMADFGYDIADYCDVDPIFGTLADLDRLIAEAHARDIRVLLDFVPNHTSDQHPWFLESRSSRNNPKRDWYLWHDPGPAGEPPNNWLAMFGGAAWTWDENSGQYYEHGFLPQQPDLNWRNPDVVAAMTEVLRFWMDRGIDGFRVDVIYLLIKDDRFRDNPPNPDYRAGQPTEASLRPLYTTDRPEVHEVIATIRGVVNEYPSRLLIGEIYLPIDRLVTYYRGGSGVQMPFNFQLLSMPWDAPAIVAAIDAYERQLPEGGWPNWVLGNHDQPRIASRVGPDQARVAAILLLTLRGTPTIYYGDEIGMTDVEIPPDRRVDPAWHDGSGRGRDPQRTPMQWSDGANAGFTTGCPWLPIAHASVTVNVAAERDSPTSILTLHRRLIDLRRREPALAIGEYAPLPAGGHVVAFQRRLGERRFAIVLNLSAEPAAVDLPAITGRIVLDAAMRREGDRIAGSVPLGPNDGVIVEVQR